MALFFAAVAPAAPPKASTPTVDERIRFHSAKIVDDPRLYPAYAELGLAYFDKAKKAHEPAYLKEARYDLQRSNGILPNFDAMKGMVEVCNYAHRFEEAIKWGEKAAKANIHDTAITAYLVEAHLGLGQVDEAKSLISNDEMCANDFFFSAARAQYMREQERNDDAVKSYEHAAELAAAQQVLAPQVWALVQCAGVCLDSGQHQRAVPYLDLAAKIDPQDRDLRTHQAELLEARGDLTAALSVVDELLHSESDPVLHSRAAALARRLNDPVRAKMNFEAAEAIHNRAIAAGEVYPLGALASLYLDAGVHLDRAYELAKRNLEYRRDRKSKLLLKEAEAAFHASRTPPAKRP